MTSLIASDKLSFELRVDPKVYSLEVCKKASYALMGHLSCEIRVSPAEITIYVVSSGEQGYDVKQLHALLLDELLDYSLRETISSKTEAVRNIILSNAFSNTKLTS